MLVATNWKERIQNEMWYSEGLIEWEGEHPVCGKSKHFEVTGFRF